MKLSAANETGGQRQWLARFWPWFLVLVVLLCAAGIRVRLLDLPLERDEGEYAYAGQLLLEGIPPFELCYSMKLPGTDFAYAIGMAVFGETPAGVHLTLLVANSLTILFIFLLGRRLASNAAGVAASAVYAVMSTSVPVLGLAAHATQFVVLCAVPGTLLLWEALARGQQRLFFASGLLFGLAFMMKQPGLVFVWFGLAIMVWDAVQKGRLRTRNFGLTLVCFCAGVLLPFFFFCFATMLAGDFSRAWFWTVQYARSYATGSTLAEGGKALVSRLQEQWLAFGGFWLLAIAGVLAAVRRTEKRRELVFCLAFLLFSAMGTTPGLYFRHHYFVLMLPAFALVLGLGFDCLRLSGWSSRKSWPATSGLAVVLVWSVFVQRGVFFEWPAGQVAQMVYPGNPVMESLPVAEFIRTHSNPDARMAVLGSEPELYFYAHRHSATGYIYTYPLMEPQPFASRMQQEMVSEIKAVKPQFIVLVAYGLSWLPKPESDSAIFNEMQQYTRAFYTPVAASGCDPSDPRAAPENSFNSGSNIIVVYQRRQISNDK